MKHSAFLAALMAATLFVPSAQAEEETNPIQTLRAYTESHGETPAEAAPPTVAPTKEPELKTGSVAPSSSDTSTASARERVMPLIEKAARENEIPAALLDAVVRVESRYNPHVKNAGAIGLMQIKLATARGIGFTGDAASLGKPETNLQWGAKYLARAYQMSRGDTCLTLARYQGGHRVAKMSASGKAYCAKVRTVLAQLN